MSISSAVELLGGSDNFSGSGVFVVLFSGIIFEYIRLSFSLKLEK